MVRSPAISTPDPAPAGNFEKDRRRRNVLYSFSSRRNFKKYCVFVRRTMMNSMGSRMKIRLRQDFVCFSITELRFHLPKSIDVSRSR